MTELADRGSMRVSGKTSILLVHHQIEGLGYNIATAIGRRVHVALEVA